MEGTDTSISDASELRRISRVKVLVVGAGSLGYELVKRMSERGFKRFVVCDPSFVSPDDVKGSFNEEDLGCFRAVVLSSTISKSFPGVTVSHNLQGVQGLGGWNYDLYIGCNESPSVRLLINSNAKQYTVPFIDCTVEGSNGRVQVVTDSGPCLECGIGPVHDAGTVGHKPVFSDYRTVLDMADILSREAINVVCGRTESSVKGVMYYDGVDRSIRTIRMDIGRRCPNHLGEPCQSILKSSMYRTMRLL